MSQLDQISTTIPSTTALATAEPATPIPPVVAVVIATLSFADRLLTRLMSLAVRLVRRLRDDRGQATTEYALVLLAAALVALLVIAWATAGGGAARISRLFNRVIDAVIDRV